MQMHGVAVIAGVAAFGVGGLWGIRGRLLPNRYILIALVLGFIQSASRSLPEFIGGVAVAVMAFPLLWLLVCRDFLGGGDAKMFPAASLLVPLHDLPTLMITIGISGGILALVFLVVRNSLGGAEAFPAILTPAPASPWSARDQVAAGLPYGVAIWTGLAATALWQH